MMETDWRFAMELSENTSAMGSKIRSTDQKPFINAWGSSSSRSSR